MLDSILWAQILHTIFFLVTSGIGIFVVMYWTDAFERFLACLICLVALVMIRRGIASGKSWIWLSFLLIATDVLCFAGWYWRYEDMIPKIILAGQLVLVPLVLVVLIRTWHAFQITAQSIMVLLTAIIISVLAVYLRSTYFPTNQVNWAIDPPFYFERLVYSNFHWPQENSLALVLLSVLSVSCMSRLATRLRETIRRK